MINFVSKKSKMIIMKVKKLKIINWLLIYKKKSINIKKRKCEMLEFFINIHNFYKNKIIINFYFNILKNLMIF